MRVLNRPGSRLGERRDTRGMVKKAFWSVKGYTKKVKGIGGIPKPVVVLPHTAKRNPLTVLKKLTQRPTKVGR